MDLICWYSPFLNASVSSVRSCVTGSGTSGDDELVSELDTDFDIGLGIKDKLIPKAVLYYTGEARDPDSDED